MTLLGLHANPDCILSALPKEVLIEIVFPHISYSWFSGGGQIPEVSAPFDPSRASHPSGSY